uniref:Uncharacterized protein n=1 Tax=Biomphalaria glabrata TaxID=6526 RepID=A0A2C9L617_BIOGL
MAHSEYSKNSCQGLTQELKTSSMDCWWKNNCTVTYIPSIIVFPEKEMPPYCFGKETNVIELKYSCVENYGTLMNDVIPKVQTIQSNKGYIQAILTEEKAFHSDHLLSQIRRDVFIYIIVPPQRCLHLYHSTKRCLHLHHCTSP